MRSDLEDLKTIIIGFAEKGSTFEELEAEMLRQMVENPEITSTVLIILDEAKEEGQINDQQYNHLLSRMVAADTIETSDTPGSDETGHTQDPKQFFLGDGDSKVETVGPGTIIKERFELIDVLGVGGMGIVYRARDLIKVEAKDRNPYLAIKVLNENFKKHPESFIALQRECSRTQKLAHPNIATVYDFDRFGSMVYMTMQLLEGKPLNEFIKDDVPAGGLSFEEAYPLIEDMGHALTYAHSQRIVHSDFKPGNSFITKEHGVQVLDFGIARAVKRPGQQDTTLFDAGKLGALTPAYASCEMLEDEDPDPRDDIYGFAVVSYILLSGEHPFDKFPATLARDHGMQAKPIKKLTRTQNKALQRGLAFHREECTPTIKEFLEELNNPGTGPGKPVMIGVAAVIMLALLAVYPVKNYLQKQKESEVIAQLSSNNPVLVARTLSTLTSREDISVDNVFSASRDALLAYYHQQIESALTGDKGPNNFELARDLLAEARQWYPESAQVQQLATRIGQHEARVIDSIDDAFSRIADQSNIYAAGEGRYAAQLLSLLDEIDPGHALHKDARLPLVYAEMIDAALSEKRMLDAGDLLQEASLLFGRNKEIALLQTEMNKRSDVSYTVSEKQDKQDARALESRRKVREAAMLVADIAAKKRSVMIKAKSGRPSKAIVYLESLAEVLTGDSPFLTEIGPKAIADSYLRLAEPLAEAGQYDRAVEMLESGLKVSPDSQQLKAVLEKYQAKATLGL